MYARKTTAKISTTFIYENIPTEGEGGSVEYCDDITPADHQATYHKICDELEQRLKERTDFHGENPTYRIEIRGLLNGKAVNETFTNINDYQAFLYKRSMISNTVNTLRRESNKM